MSDWRELQKRRAARVPPASFSCAQRGQGEAGFVNPLQPDYEAPVAAFIDALAACSNIDTERIGITGLVGVCSVVAPENMRVQVDKPRQNELASGIELTRCWTARD